MGDMMYLIGGYAVFGVVTAVFIYSLVNRQKNLQRDLDMLKSIQQED